METSSIKNKLSILTMMNAVNESKEYKGRIRKGLGP